VAPLLALIDTSDPAFQTIADLLNEMRSAGIELDKTAITIAVKLGQHKYREATQPSWQKRHAQPERKSIVYYIRRGGLIKIGTTGTPKQRFKDLMPDEILAFEPGGVDEEAARHRQFGTARVDQRGEYFRPVDKLMAHIVDLRKLHGPPNPAWRTVSNLGTGYARSRVPVELPTPTTCEMVIASEGAKRLGFSPSAVSHWVKRGHIAPAGHDESGRALYFVEHLQFLINRSRKWMNQRRPDCSAE
jgi:hypothetical protein